MFGLTAGQSFRLPKARPAKNAPVSDMKAPMKGVSTTAGDISRNITRQAKPAAMALMANSPAIAVRKLRLRSLPWVTTAMAKVYTTATKQAAAIYSPGSGVHSSPRPILVHIQAAKSGMRHRSFHSSLPTACISS